MVGVNADLITADIPSAMNTTGHQIKLILEIFIMIIIIIIIVMIITNVIIIIIRKVLIWTVTSERSNNIQNHTEMFCK